MDTSGKISEYDVDRMTQILTRLKVFKCNCHLTKYILDASYDLGKWNLVEPGWTNQVDSYLVGTAITPSPLVIVTTLPLAFLVGNQQFCQCLFLSFQIIMKLSSVSKLSKTWSLVELSGSRESSQRHWCPSLSCMRTRYKCLVDDPIKIQLIFKSFFYLYVSIETHSTSPKVAHLQPAYNTYHIS